MRNGFRLVGRRATRTLGCFAIGGMFVSQLVAADEWGRFRGPNGSGIASQLKLSDSPTLENSLLWKVEVDNGTSSPVIPKESYTWRLMPKSRDLCSAWMPVAGKSFG